MRWITPAVLLGPSSNALELGTLSVLWLLWLVGCVVSTVRLSPPTIHTSTALQESRTNPLCPSHITAPPTFVSHSSRPAYVVPLRTPLTPLQQSIWPDLSFCSEFSACRVLTAMMAFAWLGWITLTVLAVFAILTATNKLRPNPEPMMVEWAGVERGNVSRVTV